MSVVLMKSKSQQWLRLGKRECTILDAKLEWAKATAKNSPERAQTSDDGHQGLTRTIGSGGEFPRVFSVSRFDGGVPGIGWGSNGYWAEKAGQDSDWNLLFEDDRNRVPVSAVDNSGHYGSALASC